LRARKRHNRSFPRLLGPAELNAIALPLNHVTPPRPLTHDLFLTLFGRLKVSLRDVVITDFRDDIYYAVLHLQSAAGDLTLDSRPSDAIALALRAGVPVLVEDQVFDKAAAAGREPTPRRPPIRRWRRPRTISSGRSSDGWRTSLPSSERSTAISPVGWRWRSVRP